MYAKLSSIAHVAFSILLVQQWLVDLLAVLLHLSKEIHYSNDAAISFLSNNGGNYFKT